MHAKELLFADRKLLCFGTIMIHWMIYYTWGRVGRLNLNGFKISFQANLWSFIHKALFYLKFLCMVVKQKIVIVLSSLVLECIITGLLENFPNVPNWFFSISHTLMVRLLINDLPSQPNEDHCYLNWCGLEKGLELMVFLVVIQNNISKDFFHFKLFIEIYAGAIYSSL